MDLRSCRQYNCNDLFVISYSHLEKLSKLTLLKVTEVKPKFETRALHSVQFSSVAQSCLTLLDPTNRSTPGLPVHHQLPELTQSHVHRISDAKQPSHPLPSPSPPALNLSQHQGLFT